MQAYLADIQQERRPVEAPLEWWLLRDSNPGHSEYENKPELFVIIISAS
jgi:hypothetical protein